ncbi:MAG: aspartate--tRNA ligase [Nanoarchaeota archaeon]
MKRTATCGELNETHIGKNIILQGWVQNRRDHGSLIFIDLRDRYGITQIVFDPKQNKSFETAHNVGREWVIEVEGIVKERPQGTENKDRLTGKIEVIASSVKIINESKVPPIEIEDNLKSSEDVRLKYRYLDLRRPVMQKNLILRHKVINTTREFFISKGFIEIETPIMAKPTPEGARDYIIPSRVHPGKFYALPQSPQIYKQLCMIAGFDKYFQIARCFRDEDLRADRQPEFTQLDIEMSFVEKEDIFTINEEWLQYLFSKVMNIKINIPFKHITYQESMEKYGCDKPDMRFELFLHDVTSIVGKSEFKVFNQEMILAMPVPEDISRNEIDEFTKIVTQLGAKGLAWIKYKNGQLDSPIVKYLSEREKKELIARLKLHEGSTVFFIGDKKKIARDVFSKLRIAVGKRFKYIQDAFSFVWVTDFPLFGWNAEERRFEPEHHPFTGIHPDDIKLLDNQQEMEKIRSQSYDLVLNGVEICSGSIRIHDSALQKKIFEVIGLSEEEAKIKFGFFIEALKYGTPPHGGTAPGLDRLIMILAGQESIREVIAFPKNKFAEALMEESPGEINDRQLKELHIKSDLPKDKDHKS